MFKIILKLFPNNRYIQLLFYKSHADLLTEASKYFIGYIWWVVEPVIDMVVDFYIYEMILESKSKIQQYHGTFAKIDASFREILEQKYLIDKKWLKMKIEKLRKLIKVALATNGIDAALRLLAIYPFEAKVRFWRLSNDMNEKKVKSFISQQLSSEENYV